MHIYMKDLFFPSPPIRSYFQDVNHIVQIVKRFRFMVTQAEMFWRKYKEVQQVTIYLSISKLFPIIYFDINQSTYLSI